MEPSASTTRPFTAAVVVWRGGNRSHPPMQQDSRHRTSHHTHANANVGSRSWADDDPATYTAEGYPSTMDEDEYMAPPPHEEPRYPKPTRRDDDSARGSTDQKPSHPKDKGKGKEKERKWELAGQSSLQPSIKDRLLTVGIEEVLLNVHLDEDASMIVEDLLLRLQASQAEAENLRARNELLTNQLNRTRKRPALSDSDEDRRPPPPKKAAPVTTMSRTTVPARNIPTNHDEPARRWPEPAQGSSSTRTIAPTPTSSGYRGADRGPEHTPAKTTTTAPPITQTGRRMAEPTVFRQRKTTTKVAEQPAPAPATVTVTVPGPLRPSPRRQLDPSPDDPNPPGYRGEELGEGFTEDEGDSDSEWSLGPVEEDGSRRSAQTLGERRAHNAKIAKAKAARIRATEDGRRQAYREYNGRIPDIWGVVDTPRFGTQRNNSFNGMLTRRAYYSQRSNVVYVRETTLAAREHEQNHKSAYTPPDSHPIYRRCPFGIPRHPADVDRLLSILHDKKVPTWARGEAHELLFEFRYIAQRTETTSMDRAMEYAFTVSRDELEADLPERDLTVINIPRNTSSIVTRQAESSSRGEGIGIPMPSREHYLHVDEVARYALMYGRPGAKNRILGIAIDFTYRVYRPTAFGFGLSRLLSPADANARVAFVRLFAQLCASINRYREAVEDYDRTHPSSPFVPQTGPNVTITRNCMDPNHVKNMSIQDVIDTLIHNCIPVEWIDHCYTYGYQYLNQRFNGSKLDIDVLAPVDDDRLARLAKFGVPPTIPAWDGWWTPSSDDVLRVTTIMAQEEDRIPPILSLEARGWLLVGENPVQRYLAMRTPEDDDTTDREMIDAVDPDTTDLPSANAEDVSMIIDNASGDTANAAGASIPSTPVAARTDNPTTPPSA
ncbi:hypothetical protein D9613_010370 [Agrocybe pediades]|uniref:Uncharacterized protein n=1 Tax=Agrocybe pediades TaxID=84607 RepID=A0A8H4QFR2_9AGAR|nr:hypothetical protein D9613_010370 [Agrocybe pediades]